MRYNNEFNKVDNYMLKNTQVPMFSSKKKKIKINI